MDGLVADGRGWMAKGWRVLCRELSNSWAVGDCVIPENAAV